MNDAAGNMTYQSQTQSLLCFGLGFSARHLIARLDRGAWRIAGTVRDGEAAALWRARDVAAYVFDGRTGAGADDAGLEAAIANATHVLVSVPPGAAGDPVLHHFGSALAAAPKLAWIGYLSTVGVYGEHHGGWVDETTTPAPVSQRSRQRLAAEQAWQAMAEKSGKRLVIFRLSGIYGPGRSAIDSVREGRARRIIKPGQRFNRIHVEDIAGALEISMAGRGAAKILNVTDDEPAPPQDVIAHAAELIGAPMPPEIAFDEAQLSEMAKSFYGENKQVRNALMKRDLGFALRYPTYREGLAQLAAAVKT